MKTPPQKHLLIILLLALLSVLPVRAVDPAALTPVDSAPLGGTFIGLSGTNWAPMPLDPFPQLNLYTDGTNYYYDDRGVDVSQLSGSESAQQSNVQVAGAMTAESSGVPLPGDPPFSGSGGQAFGHQFTPPTNGVGPCEAYTRFWLTISASSNVAHVTITNTLTGVAYTLLEKTNLNQASWKNIGTLTNTSGYAVSTNVNLGTNKTAFFTARLTSYDSPPLITWTNTIGGSFNASAAVGPNGTIYLVNENNQMLALNPLNGAILWSNIFDTNTANLELTSSATVAADGSEVYVGSQNGLVLAFNPMNGNLLWSNYLGGFDLQAGVAVTGTPAIGSAGEIYLGTANSENSGLFAINSTSHSIDWAFTNVAPVNAGGKFVSGSAAVGPDCTIYSLTYNGQLNALNPDGSLKWLFPIFEGAEPSCSPAVGADGVIYVGSPDGYLYAISPLGTLLWLFDTGGSAIESSPAIGPDGTVYFGTQNASVYAVSNGKLVWMFSAPGGTEFPSSPAIGSDGTVYIGAGQLYSDSGNYYGVYALTNGAVKWSLDTIGPVDASPTLTECGILYIASGDGKVYALAASPPADSAWPMFGQNARHSNAAPNPACSEPAEPGFFLSDIAWDGNPAHFALQGPIGTNCDVYVSTNLSAWTLMQANVKVDTNGDWVGWSQMADSTAGAGTGNRFYQARSGGFCSDILGFVTVNLAKGTNLVANQFYGDNNLGPTPNIPQNSLAGWNALLSLFSDSLSSDLTVLKWDGIAFETNEYTPVGVGWIPNGNITILPGESAFFVASDLTTVVFAGRVPRGTLVNPIDSRTNYLSSILPIAGYLTNLQFKASSGDVVRLYAPGSNNPATYTYSGSSWSPKAPYLQVGQGFVLITTNTSNNWQTNFSVCAGE